MRILGIDQGLANVGIVILQNGKVIYKEIFTTNSKDNQEIRIENIYNHIDKIIKNYDINIIATEKLYGYSRFTVKRMLIVNMITGIINLLVAQNKIKLMEIAPKKIKKEITGNGNASKEKVQEEIEKKLKTTFTSDHDSDAASIALTALHIIERGKKVA